MSDREKIKKLLEREERCQTYRQAFILALIRGAVTAAITVMLAIGLWGLRLYWTRGPWIPG